MKFTKDGDHWLGAYRDPAPIHASGGLGLAAATRVADGEPCVVLFACAKDGFERAASALDEIQRVHGLLDHRCIPRVAARGTAGGIPYLELECDAVMDGLALRRRVAEAGHRFSQGAADALIWSLGSALRAAHAVTDPRTGRPVCLGRLSYANVLLSPSGRHYLIGYGVNLPSERSDIDLMTFEAPEVAHGGEPTPEGDYIALLRFQRSLMRCVHIKNPIARLLRGQRRPEPEDEELADCLAWLDRQMTGLLPGARKSAAEIHAMARRVRVLSRVEPDPEGFAADIATLLAPREPAPVAGGEGAPVLDIGFEVRWVTGPDGTRHALGHAASRLLAALVELHIDRPGATLPLPRLLEIGWPGERMSVEAGANRVYVALTNLRRIGLRAILERSEQGYRLAPHTRVRTGRRDGHGSGGTRLLLRPPWVGSAK